MSQIFDHSNFYFDSNLIEKFAEHIFRNLAAKLVSVKLKAGSLVIVRELGSVLSQIQGIYLFNS